LGTDADADECTSNLDPSLDGCKLALAREIDPRQAIASSSRFRSTLGKPDAAGYNKALTVAQDAVLQHEPSGTPATAVIDPLAQEALEVGRSAVAFGLHEIVLVADCTRRQLMTSKSRQNLTLLEEDLDPLIGILLVLQHLPALPVSKEDVGTFFDG
jgi:hypothetical protein